MFDIASLAASAGARIASAHSALMPRRAIVPPHYTRERLLRDIGQSLRHHQRPFKPGGPWPSHPLVNRRARWRSNDERTRRREP